ncbi:MAG TPA: hypothetical protein DHW64_11945 [Chitinophagaceae bacterium]|nr:hypothetical protein [Chitinophagaceae bacterium]
MHSALTPQRASTTLNSRLGDCKDLAVLFMSMCREAGLNANLVLVDTRDEGDNKLVLPTIGFNHCIAQLNINGKMYLIELTDNHLPFGSMSNNIVNANGLYILKENESKSELVKLNTVNRTGNTIDRITTVQFKDGAAQIKRVFKIAGAESSYTRGNYSDMSKTDRDKQFTERLSNEFGKNVKLVELNITNLDNLKDTIEMSYQFSIEKLTSEVAGMQILKFPWVDAYSSAAVVAAEKRTFPLNLWSFSATPYDKEIITLTLPAGKKLMEIPKNLSYKCAAISYTLSFEVRGDKVIATREVKYLKEQVSVNEYAEFREVVNNMLEADKLQIAFK